MESVAVMKREETAPETVVDVEQASTVVVEEKAQATPATKEEEDETTAVTKAPVKKPHRFYCLGTHVFSATTILGLGFAVIMCVSLYSLMYLGCLWDPASKLQNIPFAILNTDQGFNFAGFEQYQQRVLTVTKGQNLSGLIDYAFFNSTSPASSTLKYSLIDPSVSLDALTTAMDNGDYYGILYIPPNFSQALLTNILNNATNLPNSNAQNLTMTYVYSQARQMTVVSFVTNTIKTIVTGFSTQLAGGFILQSFKSPGGAASQYMSPSFIANPIQLQSNNIHPIPYFGLNFATYIASIVLWITAILITILCFKVFESHAHDVLKFSDDMFFKARYLIIAIAFYIMLCILANSGSFMTTEYSWFTCIMFLWLSAATYLSITMLLSFLVGPDNFSVLASFLLIMQLASSTSILDPIVMNSATQATFGFPVYYSVMGLRCLFMGSRCSAMPLNIGVQFAWLGGCGVLSLVILYRRLTNRVAHFHQE